MDIVGIIAVIVGSFGGSFELIVLGIFLYIINFNVNKFKR